MEKESIAPLIDSIPETEPNQPKEALTNAPRYDLPNGKQVIDLLKESLTPEEFRGWIKGTIVRYLFRYKQKGGAADLEKLRVYTQYLIDYENSLIP